MANLPMLAHDGKAYVTRSSAKAISLEELLAQSEALKAQGLEIVFVEELPSVVAVKRTMQSLKDLDKHLKFSVAALAVLHPGNEAESTLQRIRELIESLKDFKIDYGKYKFDGGDVDLSILSKNYNITPTRVVQISNYNNYAITISALRKVAKRIIEYWLEGKTSPVSFSLGSRIADMRDSGKVVQIGCQNISRRYVEAIFVKLGYIDEVGNILITD